MRDHMLNWLLKGQIRKLELRPGDIVLLRLHGTQSPEVLHVQAKMLSALLPDDVKAIVLDDATTLEVLRPARRAA